MRIIAFKGHAPGRRKWSARAQVFGNIFSCMKGDDNEKKIWSVPGQALDRVVHGQYVNALSVFHVGARLDRDDVRKSDSQIVPDDAVHANLLVRASVVREDDAHGLLATLSLEHNRVPAKQLQLVHFCLGQGDDRIIVVGRFLDDEPVWPVLFAQNRRCQIIATAHIGHVLINKITILAIAFNDDINSISINSSINIHMK